MLWGFLKNSTLDYSIFLINMTQSLHCNKVWDRAAKTSISGISSIFSIQANLSTIFDFEFLIRTISSRKMVEHFEFQSERSRALNFRSSFFLQSEQKSSSFFEYLRSWTCTSGWNLEQSEQNLEQSYAWSQLWWKFWVLIWLIVWIAFENSFSFASKLRIWI